MGVSVYHCLINRVYHCNQSVIVIKLKNIQYGFVMECGCPPGARSKLLCP